MFCVEKSKCKNKRKHKVVVREWVKIKMILRELKRGQTIAIRKQPKPSF